MISRGESPRVLFLFCMLVRSLLRDHETPTTKPIEVVQTFLGNRTCLADWREHLTNLPMLV